MGWLLTAFRSELASDFIEYNARPYQGYQAIALQNLYSYSQDQNVRTAAGMVLDYLSAKIAMSSNQMRRAVPYRRLARYNLPVLTWISQTREVHRGGESERIVVRLRFPHDPRCAPMQTECTPKLFEFEAVERRPVVAGFDGGNITSNAGALLLGQVDQSVGLVRRFAANAASAAPAVDRAILEVAKHARRLARGGR